MPLEPSGSPIIVDGGGSLKINFMHSAYDQPGGSDHHIHKTGATEIAEIEIKITGAAPQTIPVPAGAKAKVKITLR